MIALLSLVIAALVAYIAYQRRVIALIADTARLQGANAEDVDRTISRAMWLKSTV